MHFAKHDTYNQMIKDRIAKHTTILSLYVYCIYRKLGYIFEAVVSIIQLLYINVSVCLTL